MGGLWLAKECRKSSHSSLASLSQFLYGRLTYPIDMVAIAQLVEHRIVAPGVAGSSPVGHPTFDIGQTGDPSKHKGAGFFLP